MFNVSMYLATSSAGFEIEAKKEILRLVPNAEVHSLFFKGNLLIKCPSSTDLISILKENETRYIGSIIPVNKAIKISKKKSDLKRVYDEILNLNMLKKGERFVVCCKRRGKHEFTSQDVEREIGGLLEESLGAIVDLKNPVKVVIVQIFQDIAFIGIVRADEVLRKEIKIFRKYKCGERPLTRAEHKLREAIRVFNIEIKPNFRILDLGAAPGGWTRILAGLAGHVISVDPADLDPSVKSLPNVTHLKCKAEDIPRNIGPFDLIVNDMNIEPIKSAKIMIELADLLKRGSAALMTVKFITRNRKKHVSEAIDILKDKYKDFKVRRLPHNRYETTIYMRRV